MNLDLLKQKLVKMHHLYLNNFEKITVRWLFFFEQFSRK
jgi:hypothetical protein